MLTKLLSKPHCGVEFDRLFSNQRCTLKVQFYFPYIISPQRDRGMRGRTCETGPNENVLTKVLPACRCLPDCLTHERIPQCLVNVVRTIPMGKGFCANRIAEIDPLLKNIPQR